MAAPPYSFWHVGESKLAHQALSAGLGLDVASGSPARPSAGDVVFVEASPGAHARALPGGNAFSACCAWKQCAGVRVFVIGEPGDPHAGELARFCGADGSLALASDGALTGLDAVRAALGDAPVRARASVDRLLDRYERRIAGDDDKQRAGLDKLMRASRDDSVLAQLTDPETGLYDGPFASFKLDEELKRAIRFRQPLTLILLDIGVPEPALPVERGKRGLLFAEVAAVFLNECRDIDVLARFTPTTFLFLLPGTGHDGGTVLARRMLDGLRQRSPVAGVALEPRAGLTTAPAAGIEHREAFLRRAEACLERAQRTPGGSGVCASLE